MEDKINLKNLPNNFTTKVWRKVCQVPAGKITTYGMLAYAIGHRGGARAVGNALNKNPLAPKVPCHRVVRSDGQVGGFAGGGKKKIEMLRKEGIEVKNGKVDLKKVIYDF